MGGQGVVIIKKKGDVPVLRMETFEVIENVQSFLDLAIESRDVVLSLEALNLNVELSLGLDIDLSDREGGSNGVSCTLDEDTEFMVFHPTADT